MRKTNQSNLTTSSRLYRKHSLGQRMMVGLLCICLLLVSLPIEQFGCLAEAAQGREIVSFSVLPQEVANQTVQMGTELESLNLPQELEVTCQSLPEVPILEESVAGNEMAAFQQMSLEEGKSEASPAGAEEGTGESEPVSSEAGAEIEESAPSQEESGAKEPEMEPAQPEDAPPSLPEETDTEYTEAFTVENVTWNSVPEYDKDRAGCYVFKPELPLPYSLAAGVEPPEIVVSVEADGQAEAEKNKNERKGKVIKEETFLQAQEETARQQPGCGVISEDTVWEGDVNLADGELIVEPEVTLTIKGMVTIKGSVTIKGGGKIVRGNANAFFKAWNGVHLTVADITLDGMSLSSSKSLLEVIKSDVILDDGCIIKNCKKVSTGPSVDYVDGNGKQNTTYGGGAALYLSNATAVFNDIVIENNSSNEYGGAVWFCNSELKVYGGLYKNNKISSSSFRWGGSCFYNAISKLYIYGGWFIENTAPDGGGCILSVNDRTTENHLYGGYFKGNVSNGNYYKGGGAILFLADDPGRPGINGEGAVLEISGNVQFCGDSVPGSGVDGVYLEYNTGNKIARRIQISDTLRYPVTLYLKAVEGYVIAEGTNDYRLLHERDMKKIHFVDVGNSGKTWYAVLDKEKNEVYLSANKPNYGYYVYYISNGAEGTVVDDANDGAGYQIGDKAVVQPADALQREGYYFKEWNTKADGSGEGYSPGDKLDIQGDTDLYAIFEDEKSLSADFYSGSAGSKETVSVKLAEDAVSGIVTAPALKELAGWNPLGWSVDKAGFTVDTDPQEAVTLTENKTYYGIYDKDVTLAYDAGGAEQGPDADTGSRYASVQEDAIVYASAKFTVAPGPLREGWEFLGWNTQEDGSGDSYQEGDMLELEEDEVLYARFRKELAADFYSGSAGHKETKAIVLEGTEESKRVTAPFLEELPGWNPLGWSGSPLEFKGEIKPEDEITLTQDQAYYGVYEKGVTLAYDARGAGQEPGADVQPRYASVQEEKIVYAPAEFTVAAGAVRPGSAFTGWNTKIDGSGDTFREGDILQAEGDVTLYAMFQKDLNVTFYSGSPSKKETRTLSITGDNVSATLTMPELEAMEGFAALGWNTDSTKYEAEVLAESVQTITEDTSYYGIYAKDVTLSCEGEGWEKTQETRPYRANVHDSITYDKPGFMLPVPVREGYAFLGWNTKEDGSGMSYEAGSRLVLEQDTTLYASWKALMLPYRVEHYLQELEGEGYLLDESATEELSGIIDEPVEAEAKTYSGFTENQEHPLRCVSGKIKVDGSLVLKLFYDRDVYHVEFDLNGGDGDTPSAQDVRYGGLLQTVKAPKRAGYNFKGWYADSRGSQGTQWDFAKSVEENASSHNVTLYAKWADELAPVLGKASYGKGHKDLFRWILRRDSLEITVPITEEGSGVKQAEYVLVPDKRAKGKETAQGGQLAEEVVTQLGQQAGKETWTGNMYTQVYGAIGMPFGAVNAGGIIDTPTKGRARVVKKDGRTVAKFTIEKDFKGTISMTARDWAGNVSAQKILTAKGGGVIVEDNAPEICFISDNQGQYDNASVVRVEVRDDANENISGGIAQVTYQMDDGKEIALSDKKFRAGIVESYDFTLKISGSGSHNLRVKAVDHAGNRSSQEITVDIRGAAPLPGQEPKTGDGSHVEIYATISMIAGFTYLLLYFREHGMTAEKKEELVSRLINWAKGRGGVRRMAALALIFLLLAYYHSIGKSVDVEWNEAVRSSS